MKAEPGQRRERARCASDGALLTGAGEPPAEAGAGEGESWPWGRAEAAGPRTVIHKCVLRARETAALQYGGVGGEEHSCPNADHSECVFVAVAFDGYPSAQRGLRER